MEVKELANGNVLVIFEWRKMEETCSDCGLPAPFISVDAYGKGKHMPLCSICGCNHAADGEIIKRKEY